MASPPPRQLRWDRVIIALLLLAGIAAGAYVLVTR
jgi:hypothetical protein